MFDDSPAPRPTRVLLSGVPRIGGTPPPPRAPQTTPFPAAMAAIQAYLDGPTPPAPIVWRGRTVEVAPDYVRLMGATGAAFRLVWSGAWERGAGNLRHLDDDGLAPLRRAADALGRALRYVTPGADPRRARNALCAQLAEGRPAVGFGLVGAPDADLIAGYDEDGEVVLGWSFDQDDAADGLEFEANGMFRRAGWIRRCEGLLLVGETTSRPESESAVRSSLAWGARVLNTRRTRCGGVERWTGVVAWTAWAEHLARHAEIRGMGPTERRTAYLAHRTTVESTAEARFYASVFLRSAADALPAAQPPLHAAARHAESVVDRMEELAAFLPDEAAFADPAAREAVSPILEEAGRNDARIAVLLEAALREG